MSPKRGKQKISQEDTFGSEEGRNSFLYESKDCGFNVQASLVQLGLLRERVGNEVAGITGSQRDLCGQMVGYYTI